MPCFRERYSHLPFVPKPSVTELTADVGEIENKLGMRPFFSFLEEAGFEASLGLRSSPWEGPGGGFLTCLSGSDPLASRGPVSVAASFPGRGPGSAV